MPTTSKSKAQQLHAEVMRQSRRFKFERDNYAAVGAAWDALVQYGVSLQKTLAKRGQRLEVEHAYSPRENTGSHGGDHLIATADVRVGRLIRHRHDPLCKPRKKFWGLNPGGFDRPTCVKCIEIAERLAATVESKELDSEAASKPLN